MKKTCQKSLARWVCDINTPWGKRNLFFETFTYHLGRCVFISLSVSYLEPDVSKVSPIVASVWTLEKATNLSDPKPSCLQTGNNNSYYSLGSWKD